MSIDGCAVYIHKDVLGVYIVTYIALTKDVSEYEKDAYNMLVKAFCNLK